jgi:hypothetical protein
MTAVKKLNVVKILGFLALLFTSSQGLVQAIPNAAPETKTLVASILMYAITVVTVWKQRLSEYTKNKSVIWTIMVTAVTTLGGFLDYFKAWGINLPSSTSQIIVFVVSFIMMVMNLASSYFWPEETGTDLSSVDSSSVPVRSKLGE